MSSTHCALNIKHLLNFQINLSDPSSPGLAVLAPAASFLYPNVKLALKGKCYNDISDILRDVPKLLKIVSLLLFQAAFIDLHKESQHCVYLDSDCTESF
jgi:hypothetical protein